MRKSTIFLLLLLIISNGFWLFSTIDQSVTQMYTESSYQMAQDNYDQLLVLSNQNLIGHTAEEVIAQFPKDINGLEPFIKEGCINLSTVCVRLDSNSEVIGFGKNAL